MKQFVNLLLLLVVFQLPACSSDLSGDNNEDAKLQYDHEARSLFVSAMALDLEYVGMISENLSNTRANIAQQDLEYEKLGCKIVADLQPYTESFIYSYPEILKCDVVAAAEEEGIPVEQLEVFIGMILTDPIFSEYQKTRSIGVWDVVGCIAIGQSVESWSTAGCEAIISRLAKKAAKEFASRLVPYVGTAFAVGSAASCIYDNWE